MSGCESGETAELVRHQRALPARLRAIQWLLLILFGVASVSLAAGGYWYWRHAVQAIRSEKYDELKAIAELKSNQIVAWRNERISDARVTSQAAGLRDAVGRWLQASDDVALRTRIQENMEVIRKSYGYENMILAGADGRILLSLNPRLTVLDANAKQVLAEAISSRGVVLGDFFRCPACNQVHLDVAAPILDADNRPVAALILRTDPEQYLYPLIQSWPTPSRSAETLLIRRDGDDVLFLNQLRHRPDPALSVRVPLSGSDVPAARAALGQTGEFEGQDYRGVEVLADIRPVPGSPWFMVAKVDASEIFAEARYRSLVVLLFVVLSILMAALMAAFLFNYRQRGLYRDLYRAERERREAREEIRTTLYSIGDGVIATDAAGRVARINPVAEQLTGWGEAEALGKPLEQVFHIVNEETRAEVENPVARVLREGIVVGLANHSLLVARDGTEGPIADSGSPIRNEQGEVTGVVLVFRDQTEERAAKRASQVERDNLRAIMASSPVGIMVLDPQEQVAEVNPAAERMFQKKLADLERRRCGDFIACVNRHEDPGGCGHSSRCPSCALLAAVRNVLANGQGIHDQEMEVLLESEHGAKPAWFTFSTEPVIFEGQRHAVVAMHDITQRKRAEERLIESKEFSDGLLRSMQDGLSVLDMNGVHIDVNDAFCRITGFSREELIGVGPPHPYWPPEALAETERAFRDTLEDQGRQFELVFMRKTGERFPVIVAPSSVKDKQGNAVSYFATVKDITDRKRAEEALRDARDYTDNIIRSMADMLVVVAPDGTIATVNKATCDLLGYPEHELLGQPATLLFEEEEEERRRRRRRRRHPPVYTS